MLRHGIPDIRTFLENGDEVTGPDEVEVPVTMASLPWWRRVG
jgi:hypothetical protein